jgi:hypothetical protein
MNMDLSPFYLGASTAAATLLGLLFIAVQFNLESFAAQTDNRWRAVARSTYSTFVTLFVLPLLFLIPQIDVRARGLIILIVVVPSVLRILRTWMPVWRSVFQGRREQLWETAWLLMAPLLAYLYLGILGLALLNNQDSISIELGIVYTLVVLFVLALRNSWNLLVEVTLERKRKG